MNEGAFALLDCLGWKGIWARKAVVDDPEQLIGFLEDSLKQAETLSARKIVEHFHAERVSMSIAFVSDTIAIGVWPSSTVGFSDADKGLLLGLSSMACAEVSKRFLTAKIPLLLRGGIAFGRFTMRQNFFIGPAVDEAASFYEAAQGAFVWLAPGAEHLVASHIARMRQWAGDFSATGAVRNKVAFIEQLVRSIGVGVSETERARFQQDWDALSVSQKEAVTPSLVRIFAAAEDGAFFLRGYPVPLRTGGNLRAHVVNPMCLVPPLEHGTVIQRVIATFDTPKLDVLLKQQNTQQLLLAGSKYLSDFNTAMRSRLDEFQAAMRAVKADGQ